MADNFQRNQDERMLEIKKLREKKEEEELKMRFEISEEEKKILYMSKNLKFNLL